MNSISSPSDDSKLVVKRKYSELHPVRDRTGRALSAEEVREAIAKAEQEAKKPLTKAQERERLKNKLKDAVEAIYRNAQYWHFLLSIVEEVNPDYHLRLCSWSATEEGMARNTRGELLDDELIPLPTTWYDLQNAIRPARPEWFPGTEHLEVIPPGIFRYILSLHGFRETGDELPEGLLWDRFNELYGDKTESISVQNWPLIKTMLGDMEVTKRVSQQPELTQDDIAKLFVDGHDYSLLQIGTAVGKGREHARNAQEKLSQRIQFRDLVRAVKFIGGESRFSAQSAREIAWKAYTAKPRGRAAQKKIK